MYFDELDDRIKKGREGYNQGFTTGSKKLDSVIQGVQRGTYYLVGGNTGTGKTAFVDHSFVLMPYREYVASKVNENEESSKLKLRIFYQSFEIERVRKLAKFVAHELFIRYRIITDINVILSAGKNRLPDDLYLKIVECRDFIDGMEEFVHITDDKVNPTGIYKKLANYATRNGQVVPIEKEVKGEKLIFNTYIPKDPNEIVLSITDHIGLLRPETDHVTKKDRIDKYSEQCISLRNSYGISSVAISQFNRAMADMDRRTFAELTVQLEDFKDTGNASEDANVVMGLFNPYRYNLNDYAGIPVSQMTPRYRNVTVLKNRDGGDMFKLHQNFLGECGYFRDLPDILDHSVYSKAKHFKDWN